ncbi:MAG: flagellar biosynthetic protein FliO [Geminicoccaceae bacterium]|nr:flagellar biosynthetic protein FliO [Geminicoccaceae bacterium]
MRSVAALVVVLGLLLLLTWAARRFLPNLGERQTGRRLGIVEMRALDTRHRLVLVRHDDREHLLVLGPGGATALPAPSGSPAPSPTTTDGSAA